MPVSLFDPSSVTRATLANGLTVLVHRDVSAPVVAIVTYVKAGYFDETDDVVGVAHVLEHMYFKGTPARGVGEIAKQTKAAGGYLNAGTIYDHTSYYAVLPASGFVAGLEVQADAYANSMIDAEELARELEVIIQEAKRKADNPQALAIETLYELLHDRHRIRRWRIGREPGLRALRREHVDGFYRNFYHPGSTVLVVAGDVDPQVALREIERLYGGIPAGAAARSHGPSETESPGFRFRALAGDVAQTQLALGWRTPGTLDSATPYLDLLATALGTGRASRLFRAVRERSLASSVGAFDYTPTELGVFVVSMEGRPEHAGEALRAAWAQLRHVRDEGLAEVELERAKRILEARVLRRLEDMEGQANHLAEWEALGDWRLGDRYLEQLMTATPDDVREAARRWLAPDEASVLVYGPSGTAPLADDAAGMRAWLDAASPAPLDVTERSHVATSVASPALTFDREEAGVRVYRTAEGLPVLVRRKPGASIVQLGVQFVGGASDEGETNAGVTTLMTRAALKGTATRTAAQIAEEAELLGGSITPVVGGDDFGWSISVPRARLAAAAELLADVTQSPRFPDEGVESERAAAVAGVIALRDDMYRYPMRLVTQAAFEGHVYGVPVSGTEDSLRAISTASLREWHQRSVLEGSPVLAVVGDGDADELAATAARAFAALRPALPPAPVPFAWPAGRRDRVERREKAQTALAIAFPSPGRADDDRFAAALIATVASGLGGRFFDELREKRSLCYTVQAFQSERRLAGAFLAYIATSPEQEEEARAGLLAEFEKLRERPVSDEELRRAQTYAIGVSAIRQQSGAAVLADVVDAWLYGDLSELDAHDAQIRAVTTARMQEVARRYFDPELRAEGVVRGVGRSV